MKSTHRPITTNRGDPDRPARKTGSGGLPDTRALWLSRCACAAAGEGWSINQKKTRRIFKELGLQLRNEALKRRVRAKLWEDRRDATHPNETWAMDFVRDQLATGNKMCVLTVVDLFSRYSPVLDSRFSYRAETLFRHWRKPVQRLAIKRRSVSISDLSLSRAILICGLTQRRHARLQAFNGRFRAECLNARWSLTP